MTNTKLARSGKQNGMFGVHRKGKLNPFFGRKHSKETVEKIRLAKLGIKQTKESNEKRSVTLTGRVFTDEHKLKISESLKGRKTDWLEGENNHEWKGDDVGYYALHAWVSRKLGKPNKCDECGTIKAKKYEWANISKKYKRELKDWKRLCTKCHRIYDNWLIKMRQTIINKN